MVRGYKLDGTLVGTHETRVKIEGKWLTPKNAKKQLQNAGAKVIIRENVWAA